MNQSRDSGATVQTAVRLPRTVFEQLKASDEGVSGDLRRRLDYTFDLEPIDEPTLELLTRIARMAQETKLETGADWHRHAGSHGAFRQAILANLARLKPEGSTAFGKRPHQSRPGDDPAEIGTWIEFDVWSMRNTPREQRQGYRAAMEQTWREIVKQRSEGGDNE